MIDIKNATEQELKQIYPKYISILFDDRPKEFEEWVFERGLLIAEKCFDDKLTYYKSYWNWMRKTHLDAIKYILINNKNDYFPWTFENLPKPLKKILISNIIVN